MPYRLGAGDVLRIRLHGMDRALAQEAPVAPDGTVSFLQAKQVKAAGLTIPELRRSLAKALGEYRKDPKVIVSPVRLESRRYTILGRVRERGTYTLEQTTTLLGAIARSSGFERREGAAGGVVELADLKRSFVMRGDKRLDVDIERLYKFGDMRHDVVLQPGDYVYIASNQKREAYILGAVKNPGPLMLSTPTTVTGAVSMATGFDNDRAWKRRVLLVRGRMTEPETVMVDVKEVLAGRAIDPLLKPGDIVYVHTRPWAFAEEIIDVAVKSFIDGAIVTEIEGEPPVSVGGVR